MRDSKFIIKALGISLILLAQGLGILLLLNPAFKTSIKKLTATIRSASDLTYNDRGRKISPLLVSTLTSASENKQTLPSPVVSIDTSVGKTADSIPLKWSSVSDADLYWFQITNDGDSRDSKTGEYRCTLGIVKGGNTCYGSEKATARPNPPSTNGWTDSNTILVENLTCATTYFAHVKAGNSSTGDVSGWSDNYTVATKPCAPQTSILTYIPGDADEDGIVDGIDYSIWLSNDGKRVSGGTKDADFNTNGIVDTVDLHILLYNIIL